MPELHAHQAMCDTVVLTRESPKPGGRQSVAVDKMVLQVPD